MIDLSASVLAKKNGVWQPRMGIWLQDNVQVGLALFDHLFIGINFDIAVPSRTALLMMSFNDATKISKMHCNTAILQTSITERALSFHKYTNITFCQAKANVISVWHIEWAVKIQWRHRKQKHWELQLRVTSIQFTCLHCVLLTSELPLESPGDTKDFKIQVVKSLLASHEKNIRVVLPSRTAKRESSRAWIF